MTSLKQMADAVRAKRASALAAAPARQEADKLEAGRRWKEQKRRAWERTRPLFEAAFGRQFSPDRFTYTKGGEYGKRMTVSINYEGKLEAWANYLEGERRAPYFYIRPVGSDGGGTIIEYYDEPACIPGKVAAYVEKWGLA